MWTDGESLAVADTGNHRVLIWHTLPDHDGADADVVVGQSDFFSEGPAASGRGPTQGLFLPTGMDRIDGHFVVADAWHHRILVYASLPQSNATPPLYALGQASLDAVEANRGGEPTALSFYWPFGFRLVGDVFWVADTGNRRVLGWSGGLPGPETPADIVLGQPDFVSRGENREGPAAPNTFRWPHAIAGDGETLFVSDAGNHRVLGWNPMPREDSPATMVVGQENFTDSQELTYRPQGAHRLRFPYGVVSDQERLIVADTGNNRVLLYAPLPRMGVGVHANGVLAQDDFDLHGENRWSAITADSLCWPYGMSLAGNLLAIADSGNNRAVLWTLE